MGSRKATLPARNSVSTRPSEVAPALRSTPIAGSATATPENMNGPVNCDAMMAGTRSGLGALFTGELRGDAAVVFRGFGFQSVQFGFQPCHSRGGEAQLDLLDLVVQLHQGIELRLARPVIWPLFDQREHRFRHAPELAAVAVLGDDLALGVRRSRI